MKLSRQERVCLILYKYCFGFDNNANMCCRVDLETAGTNESWRRCYYISFSNISYYRNYSKFDSKQITFCKN